MNLTFSEVILRLGQRRPEYLFLQPFIRRIAIPEKNILKEIQRNSNLFSSASYIFEQILTILSDRLLDQCAKTWVTLMHAEKKMGTLFGETSQERFNSFLEKLRSPEYQSQIFQCFPVLSVQIDKTIAHWEEFSLEFLQNFSLDFEDIKRTFFEGDHPGSLLSIQYGLSDPHQREKTILILNFLKGKKLVYKPRNLDVEAHYQNYLKWLNIQLREPYFKTIQFLTRPNHGWVEFVSAKPCASLQEVSIYYERIGALMAALYLTVATDFHYENLIAFGDFPILIDLESSLQPSIQRQYNNLKEDQEMEGNNVTSIGLLPQKLWGIDLFPGVDVGGISGTGGQMSSHKVPCWLNSGTDEMSLFREYRVLPETKNHPTLDGSKINVWEFIDEIVKGFSTIYRLIINHREFLLSKESPLNSLYPCRVRVLLRSTSTYHKLLHESFHPSLLKSSEVRQNYYSWLEKDLKFVGVDSEILQTEYLDLWNNDVPIFFSYPDQPYLTDTHGVKYFKVIDKTCRERIRHRLTDKMKEEDLERQIWFIRTTLKLLNTKFQQKGNSTSYFGKSLHQRNFKNLLQRMETLSGSDSFFKTLRINQKLSGDYTIVEQELEYGTGLSGTALAIVYLECAIRKRLTSFSRKAIYAFLSKLKKESPSKRKLGGYTGVGGLIYSLAHLGHLLGNQFLLEQAHMLMDEITIDQIENTTDASLANGLMGFKSGLEALLQIAPKSSVKQRLESCSNRLEYLLSVRPDGKNSVEPVSSSDFGESEIFGLLDGIDGALYQQIYSSGKYSLPSLIKMEPPSINFQFNISKVNLDFSLVKYV